MFTTQARDAGFLTLPEAPLAADEAVFNFLFYYVQNYILIYLALACICFDSGLNTIEVSWNVIETIETRVTE